jgi:predicted nucleic acid-binding protein
VRERPSLAIQAGLEFVNQSVSQIHFLNANQFHRAWILFQQWATAGWSFTDCTSKVVIEDLGLDSAASFDRHFHQFGIRVLPQAV